MSSFPFSIFTPRTVENRPGVVYDPNNTKTLYADDIKAMTDEIVSIETILGLNPEGAFSSVALRLEDLDASIATIPAKATASEVRTATNDTKFITPLALDGKVNLYGSQTKIYSGSVSGVTNTNYVDLPGPDGYAINHSCYFWALVLITRGATSVTSRTAVYMVTWCTTSTPDIVAIVTPTGSNAPLLIDDSDKLRVKNVSSNDSMTHRFVVFPIYFARS